MSLYPLKNKRIYIKFSTFLVIMIMLLIFLGTTNNMFSSISTVGLLSIMTILLSANFIFLSKLTLEKVIVKTHAIIISISIIFIIISIIGLLNGFNSRSLITLFQFTALIGFFVSASLIKWSDYKIKVVRFLAITFILVNFFIWLVKGFPMPFLSIYPNPNLLGSYIFLMLYFVLMDKTKKKSNTFISLLSFILIYASESRAIFISLLALLLSYMFWPLIAKTRKRFVSFLIVVISGMLSFIFIYPNLIYWDKFYTFNDFFFKYTGKNIYSGREIIWSNLITEINKHPYSGHGTGVLPSDVLQSGLSAHNLYLQIALQNGYLGLVVFLLLLTFIWTVFWKNKHHYMVRLSASFFVAILIYQSFEVSLTQNQLSSGIIQWFIFSVGISYTIYRNKTNEIK